MEKGIFIVSILIIGFLGFISMKEAPAKNINRSSIAIPVKNNQDTIPDRSDTTRPKEAVPAETEFPNISSNQNNADGKKSTMIVATGKSGRKYKLIKVNDELTAFYIDDKKIPMEELSPYESIIDNITDAVENRATRAMQKAHIDQLKQLNQMKLQNEKLKIDQLEQAKQMDKIRALQNEQRKLQTENIQLQKLEQMKQVENIKSFQNEQIKLRDIQNSQLKLQTEKIQLHKLDLLKQVENIKLREIQNSQLKLQTEKISLLKSDQIKQKENLKLLRLQNNKLRNDQFKSLIAPIVDDLMDEKIIDDENELSFELTNDALIVNGTPQPADIHQKFKKKFLNKPGDVYIYKYSKKNGSRSTTINKE